MKKLKGLLLILLISIPLIRIDASCINSDGSGKRGSVSLSASSLTVTAGKTTTFKISAPCAAGKFTISSSNTSVATISPTDPQFLDDSSLTVTVKGVSVGTATISVVLEDVADYASNTITGTKKVIVIVNAPTTTTKKATTAAKPTTKPTTKVTEPTTRQIKEIKINTFNIVGYDINFDMNLLEYSIDVAPDVKKLYIITTGENYKVSGDKEVDIEGKDSVVVSFKNEDKQLDYKININRTASNVPVETKEVVKEVVKTNNTFLYVSIGLGVVCLILASQLFKKKGTNDTEKPIVEKEIIPLETTHINTNTEALTNTVSAPTPVNSAPVQPPVTPTPQMGNVYTPPHVTVPINQKDNNLQ